MTSSAGNTDDDDALLLVDVAARMEAAFAGGMQSQLQWLEDAAVALAAAGLDEAARDFKAALGAMLMFARTDAMNADEKALVELEGTVRALLTRGTVGLYRGIASSLREMADARAAKRATCLDLAGIFTALARNTERGEPLARDALERLAALRADL